MSIWSNATIYSQQQSLNDATRIIDRYAYIGQPTTNQTQNYTAWLTGSQQWTGNQVWSPKASLYNNNAQPWQHTWPRMGIYLDLLPIDITVVPRQIIEAQFEIALALLRGYDPEKEMRNAAVVSRGYSSVRVVFNPSLVQDYLKWGVPSGAAWNLMLPFLEIDPEVAVRLHRVS
jgi:hypothetical protein